MSEQQEIGFMTLVAATLRRAKQTLQLNDYMLTTREELEKPMYLYLLAEKETDNGFRFKDRNNEQLWGMAKALAAEVEANGGVMVCGDCNTPKECWQLIGKHYIKVPCLCRCKMLAEQEGKRKLAEYERGEQIRQNRLDGIEDSRLRDFTFDKDDKANPRVTAFAKEYCENLQDPNTWARTGVIFYGTVGTGKTYMAAAIANELISKGWYVHVTNLNTMVASLWNTQDKLDYIRRLKRYDMIVIDDLGAEHRSKSGIEIDKLGEVIDELERSDKLLIVTTNEDLSTFAKPTTNQEARVYDRLLRMCQFQIEMKGKSHRRSEIRDNYARFKEQAEKWMQ